MIISICLGLLAVFITGISQVLLKMGSMLQKKNTNQWFAIYFTMPSLVAYGMFFLVTIISVVALRELPLKVLYAMVPLNFIVVTGLSYLILKEQISQRMIFALGLIVGGVLIFNYPL